jgi:hypothetical protein
MMRNLIILILLVLAIQQSFAQRIEKLKVDKTAKMIFTSTELKGIKEMIQFVDGLVSDSTDIEDINHAYHAYFNNCKSYIEAGTFYPALLKDSVKFEFLETIDKTAFDAIWRIDDSVRKIRFRTLALDSVIGIKTLELNYLGKYLKYLEETGSADSRYDGIFETIEIAGDISPSTATWFPMHHVEFDFSLFKDRLWATVFLLRMGDPLEEKVERYLKGINN